MKFLLLFLGVLLALIIGLPLLVFPAPPAMADSPGAAAAATQHALEEQANACAQRKPECWTPTGTPTSTLTATPVPSATPTLVPTDAPTVTSTATPTPEPCWLTDQDLGDPDNGYIVFDQDGAPVACLLDQLLPTEEPTPEPEPRAVSTETPVPARPAPAPASVASQSVAVAPAPAPVPTYTPFPTFTPQPTYTPQATSTASPTQISTPTATLSPRPTGTAARIATATPAPVVVAPTQQPTSSDPIGRWDWNWGLTAVVLASLVLGVAVVWLVTRRRLVLW